MGDSLVPPAPCKIDTSTCFWDNTSFIECLGGCDGAHTVRGPDDTEDVCKEGCCKMRNGLCNDLFRVNASQVEWECRGRTENRDTPRIQNWKTKVTTSSRRAL